MTRPHVRFRQIAERGTPTAHLSSSLLYAASSWAPRHLHRHRQRVEPDHISPGWPWRPRSTAQQGLYGHARAWWETEWGRGHHVVNLLGCLLRWPTKPPLDCIGSRVHRRVVPRVHRLCRQSSARRNQLTCRRAAFMWSAPPSVGTAGATHLQIGACFDQDASHVLREGSQHVSIIIALPPCHKSDSQWMGGHHTGWASSAA